MDYCEKILSKADAIGDKQSTKLTCRVCDGGITIVVEAGIAAMAGQWKE